MTKIRSSFLFWNFCPLNHELAVTLHVPWSFPSLWFHDFLLPCTLTFYILVSHNSAMLLVIQFPWFYARYEQEAKSNYTHSKSIGNNYHRGGKSSSESSVPKWGGKCGNLQDFLLSFCPLVHIYLLGDKVPTALYIKRAPINFNSSYFSGHSKRPSLIQTFDKVSNDV